MKRSQLRTATILLFLIHVGMVLRLMASELRIVTTRIDQTFRNSPSQNRDYGRRVCHLASIQEQNRLFVEPLIFEETWQRSMNLHEALEALEKGNYLTYNEREKVYELRRDVVGRIVITNDTPDFPLNQERIQLNQEAEQGARQDLLVEIRPGDPGGDYPHHGNFRLRSFHNILNFMTVGIHEKPEYAVPPHPRTMLTALDPAKTIDGLESNSPPEDSALQVQYKGHSFSIPKGRRFAWNEEAFRLLSQLYHMTVTETKQVSAPGITTVQQGILQLGTRDTQTQFAKGVHDGKVKRTRMRVSTRWARWREGNWLVRGRKLEPDGWNSLDPSQSKGTESPGVVKGPKWDRPHCG